MHLVEIIEALEACKNIGEVRSFVEQLKLHIVETSAEEGDDTESSEEEGDEEFEES